MKVGALVCAVATLAGSAMAEPPVHPRMLIADRDPFSGIPALKARYAAGDAELAADYLTAIQPMVWDASAKPDFVDAARALGKDARPCDREAISLHAEGLHQLHVTLVKMIVIVRDVAV